MFLLRIGWNKTASGNPGKTSPVRLKRVIFEKKDDSNAGLLIKTGREKLQSFFPKQTIPENNTVRFIAAFVDEADLDKFDFEKRITYKTGITSSATTRFPDFLFTAAAIGLGTAAGQPLVLRFRYFYGKKYLT